MQKNQIYELSREEFQELLDKSSSYKEVLLYFGLEFDNNNITIIKQIIKKYNLDITKLEKNCIKQNNVDNIFVKNHKLDNTKVKNILLNIELKTYECEICGITEWENKNIVLQLHHIDGDNTNNEIQNLQILCPNCHSQTDNYCKRKICKDSKYCKICHKKINYNNKTGLCRNCLHIESLKKIKIPLNPKAKIYKLSKAEFQEIVNNSSSYKELAEKLQTKIETVIQALVYFDIDMQQFEINKFKKINNVENFIKNLSKNSKLTIHSSDLKKKLITLKLKENQCEMCGITEWKITI